MPEHRIVNLRDLEDMAVRFGLSPGLEARFARGPLGLRCSGLSYQRLAPGERHPFGHRHREQEEVYVIVGGGGRVRLGEEVADVRTWDAIRVDPTVMRAFEAGPEGLEILAFGAPVIEGGDVEQVEGWWRDGA